MNPRRFVALDRDGTLIVERNYLDDPSGVELLPGVAEGLRELREIGMGLIVVTNQSGVGRGYFTRCQMDAVHARMNELLAAEGASLDGIYVCPHVPEDSCECRKPRPGMLLRAAAEHEFALRDLVVIGDKTCDVELGKEIGALTIQVTTGYGAALLAAGPSRADAVVDTLMQAAQVIRSHLLAESSS
jgi:histidinol-phosphate phosphatase family protein